MRNPTSKRIRRAANLAHMLLSAKKKPNDCAVDYEYSASTMPSALSLGSTPTSI